MRVIESTSARVKPHDDRQIFAASVDLAVQSAHEFAAVWRSSTLLERATAVERFAERLVKEVEPLAELIAREVGKPLQFALGEVRSSGNMLKANVKRCQAATVDEPAGAATLRRRPHGVVAAITPWNNPVYIPLGKIIPALLYGNTVVWKPAPQAQAIAERLVALMRDADWPSQLVNILAGDRRVSEMLMGDARVSAVTLTGSPAAGAAAQQICTRRHIPLQAELGGNNAAIVWPDADLAEAAARIAGGAFEMGGQRCTANRRVIVHQACREEFLKLLVRATADLVWGDPLSMATQVGPLVSHAQCERVSAVVERAILTLGLPIQPHGTAAANALDLNAPWYPPTIIPCEDPAAEIVQEETFGPVLVVQTARDWDQAIQLCNGVRQGLAAAVFTHSRDIADRFLDEAQTGILKVNRATADVAVDVPFCAWKSSGVGLPKHGAFSREFYTRPQTVYADFKE